MSKSSLHPTTVGHDARADDTSAITTSGTSPRCYVVQAEWDGYPEGGATVNEVISSQPGFLVEKEINMKCLWIF